MPVIFIVNTLLTARLIHTVSQSPCVLSQVVKQITSISIEFGDPGYRGYRGRGNGPVFGALWLRPGVEVVRMPSER